LIDFIHALRRDRLADPESWENPTLARYLDALAAWPEGPDASFAHFDEAVPLLPSWQVFGEMLLAAKIYE
jgi:hypothetical protein